jgi:hypothetical protein
MPLRELTGWQGCTENGDLLRTPSSNSQDKGLEAITLSKQIQTGTSWRGS